MRSLLFVFASAPIAVAQGPVGPRPPAAPFPSLRTFSQPTFGLNAGPVVYGWYGYGYSGFGYGWYPTVPVVPVFQPLPEPVAPRGPKLYDGTTSLIPATLTVQLPAPGRVWWDGEPVPGDGDTRVLASDPLKPGTVVAFQFRARWRKDETEYETVQTIDVKAGDRSRFIAFVGTPVAK